MNHIYHPSELHDPTINYIVLGLAILFEGAAFTLALKEFNKVRGHLGYIEAVHNGKDPSLFVVLFEDLAALLGLFVALIGITLAQVTHNPMWDGMASVAIGVILGLTAIWLAYETKSLLIGEGANPKIVKNIKQIAAKYDGIDQVNEVLTLHMGPDFLLVNISIDFDDDLPAGTVEQTISAITKEIKTNHPLAKKVFIEASSSKEL